MFCNNCGHQNPPEANFCSSCGAPLSAVADDATITFNVADLGLGEQTEDELGVHLNQLSQGDAMLFVKRGQNVGATYLLDVDVVRVGRHPDNEIFLDDVTVSRRHAEFRRESGHFVLEDVGSLNGTYLNGDLINAAAKLRRGDEIQIGKFKLVFLTGGRCLMRVAHSGTRSIGEVLALLKQEFSDITISKIRFLEGQGLINPERTESGYRKFSDDDVARLRYILRQQKEHFLPLKVIKGRLDDPPTPGSDEPARPSSAPTGATIDLVESDDVYSPSAVNVILSRSDLLEASGLGESQLRELEGFGLVQGHRTGNSITYGEDGLALAKLAARFLRFGVEARHLRVFKTAADREADLYRQVAGPVLGSRNTQARMEAVARLDELLKVGEAMRSQLLQRALDGA